MPSDRRTRLESYFSLDPTNTALALDLARVCLDEGDLERAGTVLDVARQNHQLSPAQLNELGLMFGRLGMWSQAVDLLERAVAMDSSAHALRFNLGYAQLLNSSPSAQQTFKEALESNPDSAQYNFHYALASYDVDDVDEGQDRIQENARSTARQSRCRRNAGLARGKGG